MEDDSRVFEASLPFVRALKELQILQSKKKKMAEVETKILGDGEISLHYPTAVKTFIGTVAVVKIHDSYHFESRSIGVRRAIVPWEEVACSNVSENTIILQFKPDYAYEKCTVKFFQNSQVNEFISFLPAIQKPAPIPNDSSFSSESDYDDSGNEQTHRLSQENLYQPEVLEDFQEL
ncbi:uncharacterized protein LOC135141307 [Zophobas morio]